MNRRVLLVAVCAAILSFFSCAHTRVNGNARGESKAEENVAQQQQYDVYLLIGQSNMAGRGAMVDGDEAAIEGAWLLNGHDQPEPAKAPMNRHSTIRKGIRMQGINPAWSFAKEVAAKSENPVLIVCNARGATTLGMWLKDAKVRYYSKKEGDDQWLWGEPMPNHFNEAVRRCKEAMKYGTLKGIIWHQGCGNSQPSVVDGYLPLLKNFVRDLRAELGVGAEVPFIAGEIYHGYVNAQYFNPVIQQIGDYVEGGYWVSAEGCTANSDNVHFDRAGQILLGERYAAKLFEVLEAK
ncbi:MAG: hypothetical protein IKL67_00515 [Tidjanibacter sp.]|nr:hypothetical protein [Tidjanibacter sp.]